MENNPASKNGKICYIEIPATDINRSMNFYKEAFSWSVRQRGDGATAFDDTTGQISGVWVKGREPARAPGLLVYIMVDNIESAIDKVVASGGTIVQPLGGDAPELTARFSDPAGNVFGLYEEPRK